MKKRIHKSLSFLLATVMIMSTTCLATSPEEITLEPVYSHSRLIHHTYDASAADVLGTSNPNTYLNFSGNAEVVYDYQLTYYSEDPTRVGVVLHSTISSQGTPICLTFSGDVQRIEISEDLVILRGPLYTTEEINGIRYEISAGFTKVESRGEISIGLVFTSSDNKFQTLYSFGTPVLTDVEYFAWKNHASLNTAAIDSINNVQSPMRTSENENFSYVGKDTGTLDVSGIPTSASGTGITLHILKDEVDNRIMAGVETACHKLSEDKFTSGGYLAAGLYYMRVEFIRVGTRGNILGFDSVALPTSGETKSLNALFGAFSGLSAALPSPYSILASAFFAALSSSEISGNPIVSYSGNSGTATKNAWVALSGMNAVSQVNFDDKMCPIVLSVGDSRTTAGNTNWTVTLDAEYEVDLTYAAFYIPVSTAEVDVSVYFEG